MHDAVPAHTLVFSTPRRRAVRAAHRGGFTLTELLVVIAIMSILAALLTVGIMAGMTAVRNGAIGTEIANLDAALKEFKNKYGAYPPCNLNNPANNAQLKAFVAKAFPRYDQSTLATDLQKAGAVTNAVNPANALYFWLTGFTGSPTKPFPDWTQTDTTTTPMFDFTKTRRVQVATNTVSGNTIPCYAYQAPNSENTPFVYFDAASYKSVTAAANLPTYAPSASNVARPYIADPIAGSTTLEYMNPDSFQLICAGQDGNYGGDSSIVSFKSFPSGEPTSVSNTVEYSTGDGDNITNFSAGKTLTNSKP